MTSRTRFGTLFGALALLWAYPASAQSVFGTDGLGYFMEPQDGRTRALGGNVLGSPEPEISWANPAASLGLSAPGISIAYQYDDFSAEADGASFSGSTARFPMMLAVFPAGNRMVIQAGFGSYLDQNWRVQRPDTLVFGADSIAYLDAITSDGGVSRVRLGGSYYIGGGFGVGLTADLHSGSVQREEGRIFDPSKGLNNTLLISSWRYSGMGYTFGAHWSPSPVGGVGASISYGGTLKAEPQEEGTTERSYDLPVAVQLGGTGRVSPNLLVVLGGSWTGWSSVDGDLVQAGQARDGWSANGGVEWDGINLRQSPIPLRLGARTGVLPFAGVDSADGVSERALTGGIGLLLAAGAVRPDVAVEVGSRSDGASIDESYWRVAASVRVLGW